MAERLEPLVGAITDRDAFVDGLDQLDRVLLERARERNAGASGQAPTPK